jgi:hypothetical protein
VGQLLINFRGCRMRRGFDRRKIHSVSRARADQSGPANMHFANRRRHLLDGTDFFDHEPMRQKTLIDKLYDGFVVRLKPDCSKMLAVYIHTM